MVQPIEFTNTTPRFGLPFLFTGQSQKEFYVNEAHALTDILCHTSVLGELSQAPSDPVDGDSWLVATGATGAWTEQDNAIANWVGGDWRFIAPLDGMRIFDTSTGQLVVRHGAWIRPLAPPIPTSGQTVDAELRIAFDQLIEALQNAGIFPSH